MTSEAVEAVRKDNVAANARYDKANRPQPLTMLEVYQTRFAPYNDAVHSLDMTDNEASRVAGEEIAKQVDRKSRKEADR